MACCTAITGYDRCSGALSDLSASLILLALRRHHEALRNNSPRTSGQSSKSAALSTGDEKSQNRQHTDRDEERPKSLHHQPDRQQCITSTTRSNT
jgi:hypothetical protein